MTVAELICLLEQQDQEAEVYAYDDGMNDYVPIGEVGSFHRCEELKVGII